MTEGQGALKILAVSRFGIEKVTANELRRLGYGDTSVSDGQVVFYGDYHDIARANIFLRTAERIMIVLKEFNASSFEELFQGVKAVDWGEIMPLDAFIHVTAKSIRSILYSIRDIQSVSKKAIVEKLKQKYSKNQLEESGTRFRIEIGIYKDLVSVMLDTSGEGLHKRGYRKLTSDAPLSETAAAAIILISYWKTEKTLIDPFCGSGTIPIEAALIGTNTAPGIKRQFRAEGYPFFGSKFFDDSRQEALDLSDRSTKLKIIGSDIDREAIKKARYHASLAGINDKIHLQVLDVKDISSSDKYGVIITNPPYGERMMGETDIYSLYKDIKNSFERFDMWSKYILTSLKDFEAILGRKADKRRKIYNGMIECQLYQYFGDKHHG